MIVLAAPVSTSTFAMSIETPDYVSVAITNARSCRKVSCTKPPDPQPQPFLELELGLARVHEAELATRMLAAKLTVALHGRSPIRADLDDPNTIEDAVVVRAVRFERFNDEPLVGMCRADLAPPHAMTLAGCCDTGQFFAYAGEAAGRCRGSSSSVGQRNTFCCPSDVATRDNHGEFGGGGGSRTNGTVLSRRALARFFETSGPIDSRRLRRMSCSLAARWQRDTYSSSAPSYPHYW